ncbi:MAG: long-chain fatty acid--CoA ligase [Planctomycetes bacterium]|nr:long-chain fatty acid--CoA ligase [Planctomycetota bacterium]
MIQQKTLYEMLSASAHKYGDEIIKAVIVPKSDCEEEEIINH